jgi:DNA polymerase-3 subunit epsilon
MILCYDTETCGLPDSRAPSDAPHQPHLVQLALAVYSDDGVELRHRCDIIRPDGWTIPPEVVAIHGISQERALAEGIDEADAVSRFVWLAARAALRVAHNEKFDRAIMRIAMLRAGVRRAVIEALEAGPFCCTCAEAAGIVNLPPTEKMLAAGYNKPKPPKLEEAVRFLFNEELPGAHDALVDVRACARIFFRLRQIERERAA